ncbi:MAG: DUF58 domain-containing protein [Faecousia sp.]
MAARRLLYLAVLGLCLVFYIAYGQWLAWLILLTVLGLPWFSLLLSLPAMLRFRASPAGPNTLDMGTSGELWLMGSCSLPMPPFRGSLRLRHLITGDSWLYQEPEDLSTDHCGGIAVTLESLRVYDYLGLFSFPLRCRDRKTILVRPRPVKMDPDRELQRHIAHGWRPKSGGGYAENHELRLYRPGDSLNQIHWKLSAKTGNLILREAMEPQPGLVLLTMNLRGTPDQIDRKLGRLLWLGNYLLDQAIAFEVRVLTAEGILSFPIACQQDLDKAMDTLLCQGAATEGSLHTGDVSAAWHCHIGGDEDEA